MADEAARRRELRRRRILENAEERKMKIFGTGTTTNGTVDTNGGSNKPDAGSNKPDATKLHDSSHSPLSKSSLNNEDGSANSIPHIQDSRPLPTHNTAELQNSLRLDRGESESDGARSPHFRAENGIDSVPELTEHLTNLLTANSSTGFNPTQTRKINDVQPPTVTGALNTPIVPVILALFVCVLLSVNLGYVVSNSIALPFLLWEAHRLWCHRHVIEAMSRGMGGLVGIALVLCGVHQSVISKMTQVVTVMKCVFEDFAFYILTVVIWYCLIGLPGSVFSGNEFPEPETVGVTAATNEEEDRFNHMEDF